MPIIEERFSSQEIAHGQADERGEDIHPRPLAPDLFQPQLQQKGDEKGEHHVLLEGEHRGGVAQVVKGDLGDQGKDQHPQQVRCV